MSEPNVGSLFDLSGKAALITGASGHLGGALARALAEAGALVVAASRSRARADSVAESLQGRRRGEHIGVELDHMNAGSIESGFATALRRAERLDILVNNGHETLARDWTDVDKEQFDRQLSNATGYFLLSRKLRDHAVARGGGASIILLGSMYGQVASYPEAYEGVSAASPVAYHALKGGIVHMTRHLAVYWAGDDVRVNCLSPGPFPAPGVSEELCRRLTEKSPMRRLGEPWELKGALVFLASDASSYVTGQNLTVDGGWTAW